MDTDGLVVSLCQ